MGKLLRTWGIVSIILMSLVSIVYGQVPRISAVELDEIWATNEVAAEDRFLNKIIEVEGEVEEINSHGSDNIFVALKGRPYTFGVHCGLKEGQRAVAAKLAKGQKIAVRGKCYGKFSAVYVMQCEILP